MTPPNVPGTPKPESSVIMSKMFGACFGGTMRGAHQAFDCSASSLITPPNFGSGAGSCLPLIVVVAAGEPGVPVICCADDATTSVKAFKRPSENTIFCILNLSFRCDPSSASCIGKY